MKENPVGISTAAELIQVLNLPKLSASERKNWQSSTNRNIFVTSSLENLEGVHFSGQNWEGGTSVTRFDELDVDLSLLCSIKQEKDFSSTLIEALAQKGVFVSSELVGMIGDARVLEINSREAFATWGMMIMVDSPSLEDDFYYLYH